MQLIFRASTRFEAYLIRDVLTRHGIKVHVFNEHMTSIAGDIPPDVAMPQVWLDDDGDRARALAVLRDHFTACEREGTLFCRGCQEENPATFELCWNCGTAL